MIPDLVEHTEFCDAEVRADAVFEMRIPPFKVRYLKGDRQRALEDAQKYAHKLLAQEYYKNVTRLRDHVRAEIVFIDEQGKTTERFFHGEWRTL